MGSSDSSAAGLLTRAVQGRCPHCWPPETPWQQWHLGCHESWQRQWREGASLLSVPGLELLDVGSQTEMQRLQSPGSFFLGEGHRAGTGVEKNCRTPVWMARRAGAEPVPQCPVYPPAPSWLQRKSLCCSETKSSDPDCFPSRGLKSVGKQTQLNRMNLSPPNGRREHWGLSAKVPNVQ